MLVQRDTSSNIRNGVTEQESAKSSTAYDAPKDRLRSSAEQARQTPIVNRRTPAPSSPLSPFQAYS